MTQLNHTIIPQICLSVRQLSFDFHGNRSHDALRARPMCCSQPDDVPFLFEFVRIWSSYTIKRLLCGVRRPSSPTSLWDSPDGVARKMYPAINRARRLPFNQKLHRLSKQYTKLRLTPIYNCTYIYGCQAKFSVPFWIAYVVFG